MHTGIEDPARGHGWEDRPQHLAWWVGSDVFEGMTKIGMTMYSGAHVFIRTFLVTHNRNLPNSLVYTKREFIGSNN